MIGELLFYVDKDRVVMGTVENHFGGMIDLMTDKGVRTVARANCYYSYNDAKKDLLTRNDLADIRIQGLEALTN